MKSSQSNGVKLAYVIILILVLLLCFSGCKKDETSGEATDKPLRPWSLYCTYRFEKTEYLRDEEIGVTLFVSANLSKEMFESRTEYEGIHNR